MQFIFSRFFNIVSVRKKERKDNGFRYRGGFKIERVILKAALFESKRQPFDMM